MLYILAPDSLLTPDPSFELESPLLVCVVTAIVVVSDIARTCVLSLIFTRSVCFCELIALFLLSNRPDTFGGECYCCMALVFSVIHSPASESKSCSMGDSAIMFSFILALCDND